MIFHKSWHFLHEIYPGKAKQLNLHSFFNILTKASQSFCVLLKICVEINVPEHFLQVPVRWGLLRFFVKIYSFCANSRTPMRQKYELKFDSYSRTPMERKCLSSVPCPALWRERPTPSKAWSRSLSEWSKPQSWASLLIFCFVFWTDIDITRPLS